jgi:glycosyltransferase involved in cell wall biosynthesis
MGVLQDLADAGKLHWQALVENGAVPVNQNISSAHESGAMMQSKVAWKTICKRVDTVFSDHLFTARFASRLGLRHIFWAHGIEFDSTLDRMHARSLESSVRIVCNSNFTRGHVAELFPQTKSKLRVVQLGDAPRLLLDQPSYATNLPAARLVMIGRMDASERYKGHDEVIEAVCLLRHEFPSLALDLIGNGSDEERLRAKVSKLHLDQNIRFLGGVDDDALLNTIKVSTALLLPSRSEGFGLVYLYALWCGIPAIALSGTVAEEVLGECGIYAASQSSNDIALAIRAALSGSWLFGKQSQQRYRELFCFEAFKDRLTEFLLTDLVVK